eukprot:6523577-Ditylum_brightwellii.AAC.1
MGLSTDDAHTCKHLLRKQRELQYTAMLDGLTHKDWSDAQDTHLWEKSLWTLQSDGVQWTVQVIKFLWNKFFALWQNCHEFIHGANAKVSYEVKAEKYKAIIETIYHYKD